MSFDVLSFNLTETALFLDCKRSNQRSNENESKLKSRFRFFSSFVGCKLQ